MFDESPERGHAKPARICARKIKAADVHASPSTGRPLCAAVRAYREHLPPPGSRAKDFPEHFLQPFFTEPDDHLGRFITWALVEYRNKYELRPEERKRVPLWYYAAMLAETIRHPDPRHHTERDAEWVLSEAFRNAAGTKITQRTVRAAESLLQRIRENRTPPYKLAPIDTSARKIRATGELLRSRSE